LALSHLELASIVIPHDVLTVGDCCL